MRFRCKGVAKEFQIKYQLNKSVPDAAMNACLEGSHKVVNPHRQRLLVAAHKATKAPPDQGKTKGWRKPEEAKAYPQPFGASAGRCFCYASRVGGIRH